MKCRCGPRSGALLLFSSSLNTRLPMGALALARRPLAAPAGVLLFDVELSRRRRGCCGLVANPR